MTPSDLIDDLRSRINPAYANQLGTESYERRLCAEALEEQAAEIERLRMDATRYRWLRDPMINVGLVIDKKIGEQHYEYRAGDELDAAIDAAMAQTHNSRLSDPQGSLSNVG